MPQNRWFLTHNLRWGEVRRGGGVTVVVGQYKVGWEGGWGTRWSARSGWRSDGERVIMLGTHNQTNGGDFWPVGAFHVAAILRPLLVANLACPWRHVTAPDWWWQWFCGVPFPPHESHRWQFLYAYIWLMHIYVICCINVHKVM